MKKASLFTFLKTGILATAIFIHQGYALINHSYTPSSGNTCQQQAQINTEEVLKQLSRFATRSELENKLSLLREEVHAYIEYTQNSSDPDAQQVRSLLQNSSHQTSLSEEQVENFQTGLGLYFLAFIHQNGDEIGGRLPGPSVTSLIGIARDSHQHSYTYVDNCTSVSFGGPMLRIRVRDILGRSYVPEDLLLSASLCVRVNLNNGEILRQGFQDIMGVFANDHDQSWSEFNFRALRGVRRDCPNQDSSSSL